MTVIRPADAVTHELHGSRFSSFVRPGTGSAELCAWQLEIAGSLAGQPHRPSREEVLLVLDGRLVVDVDGERSEARPGDVVLVPAGASFRVDNALATPAHVWVTSSVGLEAELPDGSRLAPAWAS